ncbi:MAG TPA: ABC transporter substrate-binding protein [Solirubrobacteraceae bacterium]|nr:ABC transporter substrate-binding protein [Solirubrobacteraceae bacterium]
MRARQMLAITGAVVALGGLIAGCGDDGDEGAGGGDAAQTTTSGGTAGGTIKVGFLSDCEGAFGSFYEPTISGFHQALIDAAGATAKGKKPSEGISGATVAGKNIEIVGYGCADDTADKAIEETRRLMEQEDADILVGPLSGDEGIAVANYAKEHPDKTFINGIAGAQDATLKVQAPNFFRYHPDGAQWSAGLGDYAYNELGWRKAAIIGDDYSFPYTSLAGFVAEYCAIGGQIPKRIWAPLGEKDYSSFISQIPRDVDGIYVGIGGSGLINFIKQYEQQRGRVDTEKMMGNVFWDDPLVLKEVGNKLIGGTTAAMTAGDSTDPEVKAYVSAMRKTYGAELAGLAPSVFTYGYYTAGRALVKGLEAVNGDISDQKKLQDALAKVTLTGEEAPYGDVKLDENRQAISDVFVKKIVKDQNGDNVPDVQTFARIPQVNQTFGGFFDADSAAPDRNNPKCVKGDPPPWVGNAEEVNYGT